MVNKEIFSKIQSKINKKTSNNKITTKKSNNLSRYFNYNNNKIKLFSYSKYNNNNKYSNKLNN